MYFEGAARALCAALLMLEGEHVPKYIVLSLPGTDCCGCGPRGRRILNPFTTKEKIPESSGAN